MEEDEDMWKKIILSLLIIISGAAGFFVAKAQVTFNNTLNHVNRDYDTALRNVDLSGIEVNSDDDIVNILVVGNDYRKEKGYDASGLTDTMIIATMDMKHGMLKLTTLMRDMIVDIPGHDPNKLNSPNSFGGIPLLYKTIAQNFNIELDGYVEVGFDAFENCYNLEDVKIPNTVIMIYGRAFSNCINLSSIKISEKVLSFHHTDRFDSYTSSTYHFNSVEFFLD